MMKKFMSAAFVAIVLSLVCSPASLARQDSQKNLDSLAIVGADWHWTDLGDGAQSGYVHMCLFGSPQYISVVRYPQGKLSTQVLNAPGPLCNTTDSLARRADAKWAINGSYFDMGPIIPCTFFCIDGAVIAECAKGELSRVDGMLVIPKGNGRKIKIEEFSPENAQDVVKNAHIALSAGPLLRMGGKDRDSSAPGGFTQGRHNRSVIAKDRYGNVYMIVVDGRSKGNAEGMSIPELVSLCRYMGLWDALNLDGGGSSQIWTAAQGTLNHPSDNKAFDKNGARRVPNIVYVK